ncbi:hypothetical protein E2C01_064912 [Portunus trituberculatus]|uniref:Uncharacterized protein n=1 Tax=Portunus trituberculatus TaxID=210409 RepID=A0A5B7HN78_PORTR|nr:hypothetical protein [Portunus trituberculatus]
MNMKTCHSTEGISTGPVTSLMLQTLLQELYILSPHISSPLL